MRARSSNSSLPAETRGSTLVFALLFLFVPSINTGYWMLTALTTQLVLLMYMQVFASAIRLRYAEPNTARPYKIPGGKVGIWIVGGIGLIGCMFGFVMGFIPPTGVKHWATPIYVSAMLLGIVITSAPPFIVEKVKKRSWVIAHPDPVLIWRSVCQVSSVECPPRCCRLGVGETCCSGGEASGEVLDVGQSHMRGLATPGPWLRRWLTRV